MKLRGKVALVVGTSTNIGGGIAEGLATEGDAGVCIDSRADNAEDCARYINNTGARATPVTCDVTDERQVIAAVAAAREAFGGFDILVNGAAISIKRASSTCCSTGGSGSLRSYSPALSCSRSMLQN